MLHASQLLCTRHLSADVGVIRTVSARADETGFLNTEGKWVFPKPDLFCLFYRSLRVASCCMVPERWADAVDTPTSTSTEHVGPPSPVAVKQLCCTAESMNPLRRQVSKPKGSHNTKRSRMSSVTSGK